MRALQLSEVFAENGRTLVVERGTRLALVFMRVVRIMAEGQRCGCRAGSDVDGGVVCA
jgi:hypothetical protein